MALSRQYWMSSVDPLGEVGFAGCAGFAIAGRSVTGVRVRVYALAAAGPPVGWRLELVHVAVGLEVPRAGRPGQIGFARRS